MIPWVLTRKASASGSRLMLAMMRSNWWVSSVARKIQVRPSSVMCCTAMMTWGNLRKPMNTSLTYLPLIRTSWNQRCSA